MHFYITGFGKFGDVLENPTSILVAKLPELLALKIANDTTFTDEQKKPFHLAHSEVLEVHMDECNDGLERMYDLISQNHSQADHHVVINFGVAAHRLAFDLEQVGRNICDFRIPDERGNQPLNT